MRTRNCDYFDTSSLRTVYGIELLIGGVWLRLAENGKPCLFATQEDRNAKRATYRRMKESDLLRSLNLRSQP